MLICDGCDKGYHTFCLQPPLERVPQDPVWVCQGCQRSGVTPASILEAQRCKGTQLEQQQQHQLLHAEPEEQAQAAKVMKNS
jgi:hypothetical protein